MPWLDLAEGILGEFADYAAPYTSQAEVALDIRRRYLRRNAAKYRKKWFDALPPEKKEAYRVRHNCLHRLRAKAAPERVKARRREYKRLWAKAHYPLRPVVKCLRCSELFIPSQRGKTPLRCLGCRKIVIRERRVEREKA